MCEPLLNLNQNKNNMNQNKLKQISENVQKQVQQSSRVPIVPTVPIVPINTTVQSQKPKIAPQTDQGTRHWKTGPQKGPRTKGSRIGKSILIQDVNDIASIFHNDEKVVIFVHSARSKESRRMKKVFDQFAMGIHRSNQSSENEIICVSADYDVVGSDEMIRKLFTRVPCLIFKKPNHGSKATIQRWTSASEFSLQKLAHVASQIFQDSTLVPLHPQPPKALSGCRYVLIHDQTGPLIPRFVQLPCPLDADLVDACLSIIKYHPNLAEQVATINVRQVNLSFLPIPSIFDRKNGNFYRYENALRFLQHLTQNPVAS